MSFIRDMETAMVEGFASALDSLNEYRVVYSLVDEPDAHFIEQERKWKEEGHADNILPFAVLVRNGAIEYDESVNPGSKHAVAQDVIVRSGDNRYTTKAAFCQINYLLRVYFNNAESWNNFQEEWFFNVGRDFSKFDFECNLRRGTDDEVADNPINVTSTVSMLHEVPEQVVRSTREVQDEGLVYNQGFPFRVNTVLLKGISGNGVKLIHTAKADVIQANEDVSVRAVPARELPDDSCAERVEVTGEVTPSGEEFETDISHTCEIDMPMATEWGRAHTQSLTIPVETEIELE